MAQPSEKRNAHRRVKLGFFTRLLILTLLAALGWQLWRLNDQVQLAQQERQPCMARMTRFSCSARNRCPTRGVPS